MMARHLEEAGADLEIEAKPPPEVVRSTEDSAATMTFAVQNRGTVDVSYERDKYERDNLQVCVHFTTIDGFPWTAKIMYRILGGDNGLPVRHTVTDAAEWHSSEHQVDLQTETDALVAAFWWKHRDELMTKPKQVLLGRRWHRAYQEYLRAHLHFRASERDLRRSMHRYQHPEEELK
jgi:hypothetical protein